MSVFAECGRGCANLKATMKIESDNTGHSDFRDNSGFQTCYSGGPKPNPESLKATI